MKAFVLTFFSLMALASLFGCRHSPAEVTDAEYRVLSAYAAGKNVGEEHIRQIVIFNETVSGPETPWGMDDLNDVPGLKTVHSQVYSAFLDANLHPAVFTAPLLCRSHIKSLRRRKCIQYSERRATSGGATTKNIRTPRVFSDCQEWASILIEIRRLSTSRITVAGCAGAAIS